MKNLALSLLVLLVAVYPAFAGVHKGTVVSVDKKGFTIQPERGEKVIMIFSPKMGKNRDEGNPFGPSPGTSSDANANATPDRIKVGMTVRALCPGGKNKDGIFVCSRAWIIVEEIGPREVDFSPMRAKGKETVPECVLNIHIQCKKSGTIRCGISLKDGSSLKREVAGIKRWLSEGGWKVKEVGEDKLLIQAYKDNPVKFLKVEAEGLPKGQQPIVKRLDPTK